MSDEITTKNQKSPDFIPGLTDWNTLILKSYPDIQWRFDTRAPALSRLPTSVLGIRSLKKQGFMGLFAKDLTQVILDQPLQRLEHDMMLHTLGLTLQANLYFKKNPDARKQIRGPKADPSSMRILLKSDVFASLVLHHTSEANIIVQRAKRRAEAVLTARHGPDPSLFALPMATDTINVVIDKNTKIVNHPDKIFLHDMMQRANEICNAIDQSTYNLWYGFGQAAQDMAWRGSSKRAILGAAFLAESPDIRNIALMLSDITNIAPYKADHLTAHYSAFNDMDSNEKAHSHAIDKEFEWILSQNPIESGSDIFYQAADRQIDSLYKGRVIGWCADALHHSAKAFDDMGGNNNDALDAAKEAFEIHKRNDNLEKLNVLSETIIERNKAGNVTGLNELHELASAPGLECIRNALDVKKLLQTVPSPQPVVAPALSVPSAAPKTPSPNAAPTHTIAPLMKGPGGIGVGTVRAQQQMPLQTQDQDDQTNQ